MSLIKDAEICLIRAWNRMDSALRDRATFSPRWACLLSPSNSSFDARKRYELQNLLHGEHEIKGYTSKGAPRNRRKRKESRFVRPCPILHQCVSNGYKPTPRLFCIRFALLYGQAAVTYRFPSDHRSQAPSSGVSTWMGDHPGTPRAVGNTWCTIHMAKPRPQVGRVC